jgi:type I restriction enzyme S subunit
VSDAAIPGSWVWTTLGKICTHPQYGYTTKAAESGDTLFLRTTDITSGQIDWATVPYCAESPDDPEKYELHDGDIVISRAGSVGFSYLVQSPPKAVFASYLIRFRPFIDRQYFALFLKSPFYWHSISDSKSGIAVGSVNAQKLAAIPIPLPPLAEQKRIVAKIEELFSELEAGEESLRVARRQLGVYRQSLLKQAFEGKLTTKWRTKNPAQLEAWSWRTLEDVADVTGGLTKNPKRDRLPTRIPYLRVANVYANELRLDEIKDIGVTPEEAKKVCLEKGDLLIVEGNGSLDQIGRVALWDGSIKNCGHQNHLIRARSRAMANPAFVLMFLLSPRGRVHIEKQAASTSGLHTLSVSKVQRLPVPLCPLPEQQEIVRMLDEQFEVIERNEREIDGALRKSEALRQAILKKAFTGRLVPQDASDEPASTLLARLRAEQPTEPAKRATQTQ